MGSYGIGPARITAAAVEQNADERGISWPRAIAPWDVELVVLGKDGSPEREAAEKLYEELDASSLKVLYDDRDAGGGSKFADAELIGCPLRLTVGRRSLESGRAEAQARRGQRDLEAGVPLTDATEDVRALWEELP
jgi:prolyl-tRNA synthetase